jgi:hypothetical protein
MIGTETVPETVIFNQLTQQIAKEDFINSNESLASIKVGEFLD